MYQGSETPDEAIEGNIPSEWLKRLAEKFLTEEERADRGNGWTRQIARDAAQAPAEQSAAKGRFKMDARRDLSLRRVWIQS
jgi:uncharacterized protein with von Willebrand factor type A (vWA) domain